MTTELDPSFHILKGKEEARSPEYQEYRRRWNENPRNHVVEDFPIHLDLESTSACNLKCFMCFQSYNPPAPGYMDFDLFKKAIDEGSENGLCSTKLHYRGEPLLHPQIVDMVRYAKEKGVIEVMFNTNATLLTEEKARGFIEAGLDKMICSIDGCTKDVYESVRTGAKFEDVLENIKRLQRLKSEMGSETPYVRVQMVDTPKNHSQIDEYVKFWGGIADQIAIEDMNDYHEKPDKEPLVSSEFECSQLWQRLFVLWNGDIILCCCDHYSKMVLGNISKNTISEIWKSDKLQKLRQLHMDGESHKIPLCAQCGFRENIIKNYSTKRCST